MALRRRPAGGRSRSAGTSSDRCGGAPWAWPRARSPSASTSAGPATRTDHVARAIHVEGTVASDYDGGAGRPRLVPQPPHRAGRAGRRRAVGRRESPSRAGATVDLDVEPDDPGDIHLAGDGFPASNYVLAWVPFVVIPLLWAACGRGRCAGPALVTATPGASFAMVGAVDRPAAPRPAVRSRALRPRRGAGSLSPLRRPPPDHRRQPHRRPRLPGRGEGVAPPLRPGRGRGPVTACSGPPAAARACGARTAPTPMSTSRPCGRRRHRHRPPRAPVAMGPGRPVVARRAGGGGGPGGRGGRGDARQPRRGGQDRGRGHARRRRDRGHHVEPGQPPRRRLHRAGHGRARFATPSRSTRPTTTWRASGTRPGSTRRPVGSAWRPRTTPPCPPSCRGSPPSSWPSSAWSGTGSGGGGPSPPPPPGRGPTSRSRPWATGATGRSSPCTRPAPST